MRTREQRRMELAWKALSSHGWFGSKDEASPNDKSAAEYLVALKKTPARIHACGLGMALAFLHSRSAKPAKDAAKDVERAVLEALGCTGEGGDLLNEIRKRDAAFLFLATDEAVALIGWMTRLLEGAGVKSDESTAE
ncbi:MAG: type III-B CRISPR module-associated protein Cmr5 [Armatimonadota bacterium]|nr:type III-B CRISPR module-associated protein Cmr5 [Armatimonadota bacterium]